MGDESLALKDFRSDNIGVNYQDALKSDAEAFFSGKSKDPDKCMMCLGGSLIKIHEIYGFDVKKCECGFVGSFPRPTQKELEDFYTNGKSNKLWHDVLDETREKRKDNYASNIVPLVEKYVSGSKLDLIDVGCGEGIWLETLHLLFPGLNLFGIDPSAPPSDDYVVIKDFLENYNPDQKFDICTLMSVIEHVNDPMKILRDCKKILKPGGLIFLTAPNTDGFDFTALPVESREWEFPQHINFFNLDSIVRCTTNAGFNLVECGTFGYLDVEIVRKKALSGVNISNEFLKKIIMDEKHDKIRADFQKMISDNNLSGQMYIVARKGDTHEV